MSTSPNKEGSPTTKTLSMEAEIRRRHDLADAKAMMETTARNKAKQESNNKRISSSQAQVALEALEEAENLHKHRRVTRSSSDKQRQALELYQEAIQVLLIYLRQTPQPDDSIERSALQARIQVALTDAEQLKSSLQQAKGLQQQQTTAQSTRESSDSKQRRKKTDKDPASNENSATSAFSRLFGVSQEKPATGENSNSKPHQSTTQTRKNPSSRPSGTRSSSSPNIVKRDAAPAGRNFEASRTQQQQRPRSQPARDEVTRRSSPTSAAARVTSSQNKELHHKILDEFYIPSSTLQKTTWEDVAGLKDVKQALQESVILPLLRPDLFQGLRRPQNLLLYGPPGTGKTLLVRATASTSQALLFQCSAASLTSKWMGDAEKVVRALFQVAAAAAAQHQTPALIFLDEVDSVLSSRRENEHEASRRLKTEFMIQMEGLAKNTELDYNVLVLACTNCPWDLDPAVLRRFPRRLYVPLPDATARQALLQHVLETQLKNDHSLKQRDVRELAAVLKGYSGSDMYAIASQAAFGPIREREGKDLLHVQTLRPVSRKDWDTAVSQAAPPSVSKKLLLQYKEWQNSSSSNK